MKHVALALGLLCGSAATAAPMLPLVVVSSNAAVDDQAAARVVEEVTGAFREAILRVYARSLYGTGKGFKGSHQVTGPAGIVADTFGEIDRTLAQRAAGDFSGELSAVKGEFQFQIEVLWVKDRARMGSISTDLAGVHAAALLWQLAGRSLLPESVADAGDLVSEMIRIPMVRESEVPGGVQAIRDQGMAAYQWLRETARESMVPLQIEFSFFAAPGMVSVDLRTTIKPTEMAIELDPPEPGDVFVGEGLRWMPPQFTNDPPVARFIFKRTYGPSARANPPILMASFGRLFGNDVTQMAWCNTKCEEEDNAGQRHIMKSGPTIKGKLRTPETFTGMKKRGMDAAVAAFNSNADLFVLLNDVKFDMTNPRNPQLIESQSRIPVVLRLTDPLNGRHHVDITEGNPGFDWMARYANSRAAYKMNKAIVGKLTEVDAAINKQMRGVVALVKEMLK
jgi:hypothetical protein